MLEAEQELIIMRSTRMIESLQKQVTTLLREKNALQLELRSCRGSSASPAAPS